MQQKLVSPIEDVLLTRVHVRGDLKFIGRRHIVPRLLFRLAKQIMELCGVLIAQQFPNLAGGVREVACFEIRQRQIVTIYVMRGI